MASHLHTGYPVRRRASAMGMLFFQVGKALLVAILAILFFWLAQSMVQHRFFRGGWINRNGTIQP